MDPDNAIQVETITPLGGLSFRLLRWRDNLREVEQYTAGGKAVPIEGKGAQWHLHREMELTLIERGSGLRLVGDHMERFAGPELELLGPHLPHCVQGLKKSRGLSMQFHWPLDHPLRELPEFTHLAPLWERARCGLVFGPAACQRFGPRIRAIPSLTPTGRLGMLLVILSELATLPASAGKALSSMPFSVQEGERYQDGVERVIRHVFEKYAEPMTLAEALRLAGMSKAGFARQFPRYTGYTLTGFVNRVRLDHARRLLLGGQDPIGVIAYATGFRHLSYFTRLYQHVYGTSPSSDRMRHAKPSFPTALKPLQTQ